jgi:hypothetical protein
MARNGSATPRFGQCATSYSITTNQAAIIALFRVMNRYVGNLPPMPGVFPNYPAPVVRNVGRRSRTDHDALGHDRLPRAPADRHQ